MPRIQKGVTLSPEVWKKLKAIEDKTGTKLSRYIEIWISKPLNEKYESLGLGNADCEKDSVYHKIGVQSDKVAASSFASYSIEEFKKQRKRWLEGVRLGAWSKEDAAMEIKLLKHRLRVSAHLQIKEDRKSFDILKKKGKIKG